MSQPKLVYIKWRDPVSLVSWATEEEIAKWAENARADGGEIESVGWIFLVTDNYVVFAPHRSRAMDEADQLSLSDAHKIPISNILDVRAVTVGNKWNGWRKK